jgi:hypothetical protein
MKLINFDVGKIKLNSYLKTVWTDESMEHNSYRHFGFFTSRHYGGVLDYDKETGLMIKNVTYAFGIDLIWVRTWVAFTYPVSMEIQKTKKTKKQKKTYFSDIEIYH